MVYPEAIEERIDRVLFLIDSVNLVLNDSLSKCLSLQNELVDVQIWAREQQTDSLSNDFTLNLLLKYSKEDVVDYFNQQYNSALLILVLFVIFWMAFLWMKSKYKELQAKEVKALELGKYIFSKAATAAFLFAIIVQSLALSKKPYILELVVNLLVFFLFIVIIPGLVTKALKWSIYFL